MLPTLIYNGMSIMAGRSTSPAQPKSFLLLLGVPGLSLPGKVQLVIHPDGSIWMGDVVESSGSRSAALLQPAVRASKSGQAANGQYPPL